MHPIPLALGTLQSELTGVEQTLDVYLWPGGGPEATLVRDVEGEYVPVVVGLSYGGVEGDGVRVIGG